MTSFGSISRSLSQFKNGISIEDQKFLKKMKENAVLVKGHYQTPLALKDPDVKFPNNRKQAEKRLEGLEKQLKRDQKFFQQYKQFMEDMIVMTMQKNAKLKEKRVDVGTYHIMVCTTHKSLKKLGWCLIVVPSMQICQSTQN